MLLEVTNTLGAAAGAQVLPKDFYTPTTLGTLVGATGAVYLICNTAQSVFNFNPKWLALLVSLIISIIVAVFSKSDPNDPAFLKYFIAFLNGLLIYATAVGSNNITGSGPAGGAVKPLVAGKRSFRSLWIN